jgi:hypothetical protein
MLDGLWHCPQPQPRHKGQRGTRWADAATPSCSCCLDSTVQSWLSDQLLLLLLLLLWCARPQRRRRRRASCRRP